MGISDPVKFYHHHHHDHEKRSKSPPVSALLTREFLVTKKFKDILGNDSSKDCAVCLDEFNEEDEIRCLTNCKHMFHQKCLDRWMDQIQETCPLCRAPILPLVCQDEYKKRFRAFMGLDNFYGEDFVIMGL